MNIQILLCDSIENPMGGMGIRVQKLLKHLKNEDLNIDVISSGFGEDYRYSENIGINFLAQDTTYVANRDPMISNLLKSPYFVSKSLSLRKPDIIHALDWSTFSPATCLIREYKDCRLFSSIQLSIDKCIKREQVDYFQLKTWEACCELELKGMLEATAIEQVSKNYSDLFNRSLFRAKTFIIENGVDVEEFEKKNIVYLPGKNKKKIAYIGRFTNQKNIYNLCNVDFPKDCDMYFIGGQDGSEPECYKYMINTCHEKENCYYLGKLSGQEKIDIMMEMDLAIFPSRYEPFGIVGLEWMAARVPMISTRVHGMQDYMNDENSILCGIDSKSIENKINEFFTLDIVEVDKIKENGYNCAKTYSWENISKKTMMAYSHILKC